MFLIGSRAAEFHGLKIERKTDKSDWDIIGSKAEFDFFIQCWPKLDIKESSFPGKFTVRHSSFIVEFDATENPSNKILEHMLDTCTPNHFLLGDKKTLLFVPSKFTLYQIKRAHVNFDVHFMKTLMDLRAMMKQWDMYGNENLNSKSEFYLARHREAKERFGKRQERIKLNKPLNEFFKGGSNLRTYMHDDLHQAVAYYDKPLFMRCQPDPNKAWIDKNLFFSMTKEDQIKMAMEESMVIALEREYIPNRDNLRNMSKSQRIGLYRKGMIKEIKDLSKGWFQDFMIDHILELEDPQWNFVEKFENALSNGELRENVKL